MAFARIRFLIGLISVFFLSTGAMMAYVEWDPQQSATQIVGSEPKAADKKDATDASKDPAQPQGLPAPLVLPVNAVLPPAPIAIKQKADQVSIPATAANTPASLSMVQNFSDEQHSDEEGKPAKGAAPTPKVEVIKPETVKGDNSSTGKYVEQPVLASSVRVGSTFGYRIDPFTGRAKFHSGLDIKAEWGDPVCASQAGVVKFASWHNGYGYMVTVDHGGGITTNYAHLSRFNVVVGLKVTRGSIIGYAGSTGRSTSPHLHYEVRINDRPVHPLRTIFLDEDSQYFIQTQTISSQFQNRTLRVEDTPGASTKMSNQ
ncbi:MAG: M23 family metallopeptidase [Acidobacteriota bacterium]